MNSEQRPISPFMIGPYYRPQLTSMLSITHRGTGVFLSLIGAPLLLGWLVALAAGPEHYQRVSGWLASAVGQAAVWLSLACLYFHLLSGTRHLFWDSGRLLDIKAAYASGWLVLFGTAALTALTYWIAR